MKALGKHFVLELSQCDPKIIGSLAKVQRSMVRAALEAKAEVREIAFHKFNPQGVSGVVVIAESHLAIHTWPEYGYAAVDIYTCGEKTLPQKACEYLEKIFHAKYACCSVIERGMIPEGTQPGMQSHGQGTFIHKISASEQLEEVRERAKNTKLAMVS